MITLLDNVKTLIEYAKFGMFICKYENGETGELFFPRAREKYQAGYNGGWQSKATKITGYLKAYGSTSCLRGNTTCEVVDLPECIDASQYSWISDNDSYTNVTLKIIKLPKLRNVTYAQFKNCKALEYLELGAVTKFQSDALRGCDSLTEFYVAENTTSSLFLYHCPNLTQECLHKVIENYADMTGTTGATFHIGLENIRKIDSEHIAMLESKNIFYQ